MASVPRRNVGYVTPPRREIHSFMPGPAPSNRFSPFKELGTSGIAVFGGRPVTHEKSAQVRGPQRWITYSEMVSNTSIIAAGVRYFLNIVANADWTMTPANDTPEAQETSDLIEEIINDMVTPFRRVARRAAMYRFQGFGIQEWTAKKRADGKIGLEDIEVRPAHTIDRWQMDDRGSLEGVWQLAPQTSEFIYLPRGKILYLVEDTLTDSPEGMGLFRHLLEPYERLKKYLVLEGRGFERDLRGIPIGRVPYRAIAGWVADGAMTADEGRRITNAIEDFVKIQSKAEDTSIVLDSAPYVVETEGGKSVSGVPQYGLELLTGQSPDFPGLANAVQRINEEMARIIGTEHLMLGGAGAANRALSEDKSRNFYLTVNGSLDDIGDAMDKDIVAVICDLNGIKDELRPEAAHSDVSFRSVLEITSALGQMAAAGAVLTPDDPAINDVRELLGLQMPPEPTPERLGLLGFGQQEEVPGEEGEGFPKKEESVPGNEEVDEIEDEDQEDPRPGRGKFGAKKATVRPNGRSKATVPTLRGK